MAPGLARIGLTGGLMANSFMLGGLHMVRMADMLLWGLGGHWDHWLGDRRIRLECWLEMSGTRDSIALFIGWRLGHMD